MMSFLSANVQATEMMQYVGQAGIEFDSIWAWEVRQMNPVYADSLADLNEAFSDGIEVHGIKLEHLIGNRECMSLAGNTGRLYLTLTSLGRFFDLFLCESLLSTTHNDDLSAIHLDMSCSALCCT
jgi:hypothetical protein